MIVTFKLTGPNAADKSDVIVNASNNANVDEPDSVSYTHLTLPTKA